MTEFKCSLCDYKSPLKSNIIKHINKKVKCGDGNPTFLEIKTDIICDYCRKNFSTRPNLSRHLKTCKIKKINLEEENKKLKEELAIAKALVANRPSTTINNNNNNQTNVIINLAPWNDPKLPSDVNKYYKEAVKKIFLAIPTIIKCIHFNSEHPENHNICIRNGRSKTAKVYNGKEWETIDEDRLINTLIDDYEHTLENYAEENHPIYLEQMREIKERDTEEKVYDDLRTEVKRAIYDRNYMIKIKN